MKEELEVLDFLMGYEFAQITNIGLKYALQTDRKT
jgi:hypothetical protein